tara:strand:- start:65 stop:1156 length:1092 start_codon:yes stop_codon:yes gene_type:complete
MESAKISKLTGPEASSIGIRAGGVDDVGSLVSNNQDLPTPDPARFPLLTFTVPASGTETVAFTISAQTFPMVIYWGDGTLSHTPALPTVASHAYTGLTPGDQITINTSMSFNNTWKGVPSVAQLENLTFWWGAIEDTKINLNLKDLGITRSMPPKMDGVFNNLNLKGNSIPGEFPSGINASGGLFINENNFRGDLPVFRSNSQTNYSVQGNGFRGTIHDISGDEQIVRYNASRQDDGITASTVNPRIMLTGEIPNLSGCTSLIYYHVGNGGLAEYNKGLVNNLTVAADFDVHEDLEEFYAGTAGLSESEVDFILAKFAAKAGTFTNPKKLNVGGRNAEASAAGLANKSILQTAGWEVITAPDF